MKTIEHLSKPQIIYLVKYLCCKTEHKTQLSFSQRQKILKCLWSKNFELQKCCHIGKSNYGLNLSIILMFLTIYGVEESQCDRSKEAVFSGNKSSEAVKTGTLYKLEKLFQHTSL